MSPGPGLHLFQAVATECINDEGQGESVPRLGIYHPNPPHLDPLSRFPDFRTRGRLRIKISLCNLPPARAQGAARNLQIRYKNPHKGRKPPDLVAISSGCDTHGRSVGGGECKGRCGSQNGYRPESQHFAVNTRRRW